MASENKTPALQSIALAASDIGAGSAQKLSRACGAAFDYLGIEPGIMTGLVGGITGHDSDGSLAIEVRDSGLFFHPSESETCLSLRIDYTIKRGQQNYRLHFYVLSRSGIKLTAESTDVMRARFSEVLGDFPERHPEELAALIDSVLISDKYAFSPDLGVPENLRMEMEKSHHRVTPQSIQLANLLIATTSFITSRFVTAP